MPFSGLLPLVMEGVAVEGERVTRAEDIALRTLASKTALAWGEYGTQGAGQLAAATAVSGKAKCVSREAKT
ncbi:hypothetical protein [Nocardia sp. NPDC059228]